jgi:uncharacterized lipoprotein YddW (UPF0748 family)
MRFAVIFLLLVSQPLAAQEADTARVETPRYELRGAWITTAFGIDFPKTLDPDKQKADLDSIFKSLKAKKFNAVFFQVRVRADVMYNSQFEPYHEYAAGKGKLPIYDITQYAIDLARKHGLEFHAWFNTLILRGKDAAEKAKTKPSLWQTHPDWIDSRTHSKPKLANVFLNPSKPEVRNYLIALIADFARRYDTDGIQLCDYLRYPEPRDFTEAFADADEFKKFNPKKLPLADWRRENINDLVARLRDTLSLIKPYLKFGVTPMGIYRKVDAEPATESVVEVYQDSRAWTERKTVDYVAPQIYFHIGGTTASEKKQKRFNPPFDKLVADWAQHKNERHLYVGIGTYKPAVKKEWKAQLDLCRKNGAEGFIFYPYSSIADIPEFFSANALVPPMPWKPNPKPMIPTNISLKKNNGTFRLSWSKPAGARWVNIYRRSESMLVPWIQNVFAESFALNADNGDEFYLTAVDRTGNESAFSGVITVQ